MNRLFVFQFHRLKHTLRRLVICVLLVIPIIESESNITVITHDVARMVLHAVLCSHDVAVAPLISVFDSSVNYLVLSIEVVKNSFAVSGVRLELV